MKRLCVKIKTLIEIGEFNFKSLISHYEKELFDNSLKINFY